MPSIWHFKLGKIFSHVISQTCSLLTACSARWSDIMQPCQCCSGMPIANQLSSSIFYHESFSLCLPALQVMRSAKSFANQYRPPWFPSSCCRPRAARRTSCRAFKMGATTLSGAVLENIRWIGADVLCGISKGPQIRGISTTSTISSF